MVSFKACPRCNGDVVTKMDMYGQYNECLQCGHAVDLPTQRAVFNWTKGRLKAGSPSQRRRTERCCIVRTAKTSDPNETAPRRKGCCLHVR